MKSNTNAQKSAIQKTEAIIRQLTLQEKLRLLSTHHQEIERLDIPEFFIGGEVARGYVGREPDKISTVFPQPVGLAATFDTDLMTRLGQIAGTEGRAYYNRNKNADLCLWGPTVDPVHDPRWGRTEEAYGEDPYLAGTMSTFYTCGMAGYKGTDINSDEPLREPEVLLAIPTLKHFCANTNEQDRGTCNTFLPLRLKYEYYYASFEYAIRCGGAKSLMAAYNEINGIPGILNPELKTVLKDRWGLWFAVSDGGDFSQTVTMHKYCDTYSEAYQLAVRAGCDTMTDNDELVIAAAKQALARGLISEADIDSTIFGPLYARVRLGILPEIPGASSDEVSDSTANASSADSDRSVSASSDTIPYRELTDELISCEAFRQVNRRAALEQVVLLKNDGILPLSVAPDSIAVVGPLADENLMDWYTGYSDGDISVSEGMRREFPDADIITDSLWDRVSILTSNGCYLSAKENGELIADATDVTDTELFELQDWGDGWINLFSVAYRRYVRMMDNGSFELHNRKVYDWFTRETLNFTQVGNATVMNEYLHQERIYVGDDRKLHYKPNRKVDAKSLFFLSVVSSGSERASMLANTHDVVVYCTGNHPVQVAKECYDRKTLALTVQSGMAVHLASCNPFTVMALISSYPYAITEESRVVPAIVYSSHAGAWLGPAIAETLSGRNNPSGHLPLTWYRSDAELPSVFDYDIETTKMTYRYFTGFPLYPFGHGLSYSEFTLDSLSAQLDSTLVEQCTADACDSIDAALFRADVTVSNRSAVPGTAVVQIYFSVPGSVWSRPIRSLCGFARVPLQAHETQTVRISLHPYPFRVYNPRTGKMILEPGTYRLEAGLSSAADGLIATEVRLNVPKPEMTRPASFTADSMEASVGFVIDYSKQTESHYIISKAWTSSVLYRGISVGSATTLTVTAMTVDHPVSVRLSLESGPGTLAQIPAPFAEFKTDISDGPNDFHTYSVTIPDEYRNQTLTLLLATSDGVAIRDITLS